MLLLSQEVFSLNFLETLSRFQMLNSFEVERGGVWSGGGACVRLGPLISRRDQSWFHVSAI